MEFFDEFVNIYSNQAKNIFKTKNKFVSVVRQTFRCFLFINIMQFECGLINIKGHEILIIES